MISTILNHLPQRNRFERIWKIGQVEFRKTFYNDKLGILWALLNPLLRLSIYYLAFAVIIKRVSEGIPNFALFVFSGLIFWMEFTKTLKKGMKILQKKRYLIEYIKINKIDLFLSLVVASTLAFLFNLIIYILLSALLGIKFSINICILPVLIINVYLITIGLSMILSVLYLVVRDIEHLVDILLLLGFWISGIFFPAKILYTQFPLLYYFNPFLGILDNVRSVLVYNNDIDYIILNINLLSGIGVFIIGYKFLTKYSQKAFEYL